MAGMLIVLIAFAHLSMASEKRMFGAMALPESPFHQIRARQDGSCPKANETPCPDNNGCCQSGAVCGYNTRNIPICSVNCNGGPTCTGILAGLCCQPGEVCVESLTGCTAAATPPPVVVTTAPTPPAVSTTSAPLPQSTTSPSQLPAPVTTSTGPPMVTGTEISGSVSASASSGEASPVTSSAVTASASASGGESSPATTEAATSTAGSSGTETIAMPSVFTGGAVADVVSHLRSLKWALPLNGAFMWLFM